MSTKLPQLTRDLIADLGRMDNGKHLDCCDSECLACACLSNDTFTLSMAIRECGAMDSREAIESALSLSLDGCDGGK